METITSDSSNYKQFQFLTKKFTSGEVRQAIDFQHFHDFDYHQGEWVKVLYENEPQLDLFLMSVHLINIFVLSVWFLFKVSLSLKGIEFGIVSLMCLREQIMIQQWTEKVVCTSYKHLIHAYH